MNIVVREAKTEEDFQSYYETRWEILRKPWNQPKGSEKDTHEDTATHIIACIDNSVVGAGRVHINSEKEAQIRYMAVKKEYQGKGIGTLILNELERAAKEKGADYIVLNARENAIKFYEMNGYSVSGTAQTLFGSVHHQQMKKLLVST